MSFQLISILVMGLNLKKFFNVITLQSKKLAKLANLGSTPNTIKTKSQVLVMTKDFSSMQSNTIFFLTSSKTKRLKLAGIFSLLSLVMFPIYAADCVLTLGSSTACVELNAPSAGAKTRVELEKSMSATDEWNVVLKMNLFTSGGDAIGIKANKAIVKGYKLGSSEVPGSLVFKQGLAFQKDAGFILNTSGNSLAGIKPTSNTIFKDSVLSTEVIAFQGNLGVGIDELTTITSNVLNFDGHYSGTGSINPVTSSVSMDKKYALIATNKIISQQNWNILNFTNNANVKANLEIKQANPNHIATIQQGNLDGYTTELHFKNSSMEGDITYANPNDFANNPTDPNHPLYNLKTKLILSFDGKGDIEDSTYGNFSFKGDIKGGMNIANITFKDGKMLGNLYNHILDTVGTGSSATTKTRYTEFGTYTFDNSNIINGKIEFMGDNKQTLNFINSKINLTNRMELQNGLSSNIVPSLIYGDETNNLPKNTYGSVFSSQDKSASDWVSSLKTALSSGSYTKPTVTVDTNIDFKLNVIDNDIDLKDFTLNSTKPREYRFYDAIVKTTEKLSAMSGVNVSIQGDQVIFLADTSSSDFIIDATSSMDIHLSNSYIENNIVAKPSSSFTFMGTNIIANNITTDTNSYISLEGLSAATITSKGVLGKGNLQNDIKNIILDGTSASIDKIATQQNKTTMLTLKNGAKLGRTPSYNADSKTWEALENEEKNFVVQGEGTLKLSVIGSDLDKNILDFQNNDADSSILELSIEQSSTKEIVLTNTQSTLNLSNMSNKNIGSIDFRGKSMTGTFDAIQSIGTIKVIHGNATNTFKNTYLYDNMFGTLGGSHTINFEKSSVLAHFFAANSISHIKFTSSAMDSISFPSPPAPTPPSPPADTVSSPVSDVSGVSKIELASADLIPSATLDSSATNTDLPIELMKFFQSSGISTYIGSFITGNNATQSATFENSLYLGGKISTDGGTTNVAINLSDEFVNKLLTNDTAKAVLQSGVGPRFIIETLGGVANFAIEGNIKGVADITYAGGNTNLIFADVKTDTTPTDNTDLNNYTKGNEVVFNNATYQDGVLIRLQSEKADKILKPYRKNFQTNFATFMIDKFVASASNSYIARIQGIMIGEIDSLQASSSSPKRYEAILENQAVFIGKLNITNDTAIKLQTGSKLILHSSSTLSSLASDGAITLSQEDLGVSSLLNKNAIVDLAAGNESNTYSKLTIKSIDDLSNTLFRVSYDSNVDNTVAEENKNDHIIIENVTSTQGVLNNHLQVFQRSNPLNPGENLLNKKILVASVKNGTDGKPLLVFGESKVYQGYDETTTSLETKVESSPYGESVVAPEATAHIGAADDTTTPADTTPADATDTTPVSYTNYYVKSTTTSIQGSILNSAQSALVSNYSIFIDNINNLNRRLGELRFNPLNQGAWARIYNSMSKVNRGDEVSITSINFQAGYDYSLAHNASKSILGVALAYGRNSQSANSFEAKANLFELGAYYSWIDESGLYSDSILKYGFVGNTLSMKDDDELNKDMSLNSSIVSFGEEVGYRFDFNLKETRAIKHVLYLEPQAEFVLGYLSGSSFEQKNLEGDSLNSSISSVLAFRGRVGGVVGYSLKSLKNQTDLRMGLSYVGDFGSTHMDFQTKRSKQTLPLDSNHMAVLSFGVNSIINSNWRVYADVETGFAGKYYNQTYLVSLGGRYAFGKADPIKQQRNQQTQHNALAKGYYLEIYSIPETMQLNKEQENLLQNYPYSIERTYKEIKDAQGKIRKVAYKNYLLGVFKSQDAINKNQKIANDIASLLYGKNAQAIAREIK